MRKRLTALLLSVLMVVSVIPTSAIAVLADDTSAVTVPAFPTTPVLQNTNQGDGIILAKYAQPHLVNGAPDGTVDIVIQAHTTGQVTRTDAVVPTDIALVLDLSGSMDQVQGRVTRTDYTVAYATETRYGAYRVYYTMNTTGDMYIKTDADMYTRVRSAGFDDNGYQYYYYGGYNNRTYVYPELEAGLTPNNSRSENYGVEQFYTQTTVVVDEGSKKIDLLKEAVDEFIANTADYNETLVPENATAQEIEAAKEDMHRISIIKFGTAAYFDEDDLLAEGNETNNYDYNYCQVVKDFLPAYAGDEADLITAMNALEPGGATAVDYGMYLADLLFAKHETTEAAQGRNKVVIVLTDGAPTHGSDYQSSVAGAAINYAKVLKDENVKVYTISVEDGADGTELGSSDSNRFMHYLSSNYPSASYANGTITAGTGSPANGYYLTPDTTHSLSMIFEKLNQEIGEPSISLGEEATLVDTVSEFFTIPATGANRVTVATADRLAGGVWDTAKLAGLTPTISGNTVTVEGFDFDENYVSNEPRTVNGEDFYGRMLILTINVTPDYSAIDAHADEIAANGGAVETNYGTAEVMSGTSVVASVDSPTIALNTITYEVDGDGYATYYRLPGGEHTLIAAPTKTGYTFSGWSTTDATVANGAFTMPEADVTVVGEFTANTHDVTYQFVGLQVYDETILDDMAQKDVPYGATVEVKYPSTLTLDGYTFVGWYPQDEALGTGNLAEFSMPDHDVVLLGRYVPDTSTAYKVEHYTENLDGTFKLEETENLSGVTGARVTAAPNDYEGFTYNANYDSNGNKTVASGTIAADGSLTLTLYYTRNEYELTYEYVGTVPLAVSPTEAILEDYFETRKYGETVTVNPDASAAGYIFTGWYSTGGTVTSETASFTMPAHDVTLHGYFSARTDLEYQVEHYFENANDNSYTLDSTKTETFRNATVGQVVEALPLNVQGYTFNPNNVNQYLEETITGKGTVILKVYYERVRYTVTYDYEGAVPANVTPAKSALGSLGGTYKWGQTVPAPTAAPTASGYEFHGWYFNGSRDRITADFEMPAHDVLILGHFDPTSGLAYYVEHYFENENGEYDRNSQYDETFKGDKDQTVTATPVDVAGYVYNANASTATGIVPEYGSVPLILKLYYDYAPYTVTYSYEGFVPSGASGLPATETHDYKSSVTVAGDASAPGYTFKGWYRNNDATKTEITSFEMPAYNVELAGRFVANTDTPYTVEHYLETTVDGVYEATPYKTENLTGTTGTQVTATPIGIDGYTYNQTESAATRTGYVTANDPNTPEDESLVLRLYYDRNTYTVTYVYTSAPDGAELPVDSDTHAHGSTVTVKNADDIDGYTFSGWTAQGITVTGGTNIGGGTFEMPMANVIFVGSYMASEATYNVEHWVQDGDDYVLHGQSEVRVGKTGQKVTAASHVIHGYTYSAGETESKIPEGSGIKFAENTNKTILEGTVNAAGTLTLAFYYTANEYDVTYVLEGTPIPTGAVAPNKETKKFGEEVSVHGGYDIPGYTFSGWTTTDTTVVEGKFDMPANNVTLKGSFTADSVNYKIKYWQQVLDGTTGTKEHNGKYYDEVVADEVTLSAITGHYVSAYPDYIKTYEGFTATPADNDQYYGYVKGDGSLVLNLYYNRLTYNVTYVYSGVAPEGVEIPNSYNKTGVMFGATVDVEEKLDAYDGFEFDGWHSAEVNITNDAESFTMPARNVIIHGRHNGEYEVRYYVDDKLYETFTVSVGAVHDIIEKPKGATSFLGWEDPINVKEDESFEAVDNEFVMPWSDVEIYGEFANIIIPVFPRGTLTVSKDVVAPDDFTAPEEYTFDIYEVDGDELDLVETIVLKDGESKSVRLSPADYKVVERSASVEGYTLDTVCDDEDATVTVSNNKETKIAFTNTYEEILLERDDHFGYIIGYPDGTVRPEAEITRAEVVTIFFRMFTDSARDTYWAQTNKFTDVNDTDWYNTAISTLANAGVLDGYTDGTFKPNDTITRAELIKIATSFYDTTAGKDSEFSDIKLHWAESFIEEAYKLGIVEGYGDGTFHPDQAVTRAEAMKIVNRTLERAPHKDYLLDSMIKWPDNADTEKWYYAEVQEATNSHDYDMEGDHEKWTALLPMRDWAALELTWREEHDGE